MEAIRIDDEVAKRVEPYRDKMDLSHLCAEAVVMATRELTITIPEELAERLEPWRDNLNLSRLCSGAIEREVIWMEHFLGQRLTSPAGFAQLRDSVILEDRRLRRGSMVDWETGRDCGQRYGLDLSLKEMQRYTTATADDAEELLKPAEKSLAAVEEVEVVDGFVFKLGWVEGMAQAWMEYMEARSSGSVDTWEQYASSVLEDLSTFGGPEDEADWEVSELGET